MTYSLQPNSQQWFSRSCEWKFKDLAVTQSHTTWQTGEGARARLPSSNILIWVPAEGVAPIKSVVEHTFNLGYTFCWRPYKDIGRRNLALTPSPSCRVGLSNC